MGPYCKFCDKRCFVPNPEKAGHLLATCRLGRVHDHQRLGYCWDEAERLLDAILAGKPPQEGQT